VNERQRYSNKISKNCTLYGLVENDAHLFFHYTFARAANPPLCTSVLPQEQDGVQEILPHLIHDQTTDEQMITFLITLWYIWKARNDHCFSNKKWTIFQVHSDVKANIAMSSVYLQQDEE
jgi:hypothetical protein